MESEDCTHFTDSVGQGPTASSLDGPKDLAISSELEEPINLSVKKPFLAPVMNSSTALQQYRNPKGETRVIFPVGHRPEQATQYLQVWWGRWIGSAWGLLLIRPNLLLSFRSNARASASLTMGSTDLCVASLKPSP